MIKVQHKGNQKNIVFLTIVENRLGAQFDEEGRLSNWWSKESENNYKQRAETIIKQYGSYNTSAGLLNGNLTAGENIADNGGMKEAFLVRNFIRIKVGVMLHNL